MSADEGMYGSADEGSYASADEGEDYEFPHLVEPMLRTPDEKEAAWKQVCSKQVSVESMGY